jgi:hypothetical protein
LITQLFEVNTPIFVNNEQLTIIFPQNGTIATGFVIILNSTILVSHYRKAQWNSEYINLGEF